MLKTVVGGLPLYRFEELGNAPRLVHAVSTRVGGASTSEWATLNLGLHVGDEPNTVLTNRRAVFAALELPLDRAVCPAQVHGGRVAIVGEETAGKGAHERESALPCLDGLVTTVPNLPLMAFFADCAPVLAYDAAHGVLGLGHAGWRGLAANLPGALVAAMVEAGADAASLRVGVGPSIGPCCYEVGSDVLKLLDAPSGGLVGATRRVGDATFVDLELVCRRELEQAGVSPLHIETSGLCTACRTEEFYSHRAEHGHTGRFGVVAALRRE
jgi:polyphenol oxidase